MSIPYLIDRTYVIKGLANALEMLITAKRTMVWAHDVKDEIERDNDLTISQICSELAQAANAIRHSLQKPDTAANYHTQGAHQDD